MIKVKLLQSIAVLPMPGPGLRLRFLKAGCFHYISIIQSISTVPKHNGTVRGTPGTVPAVPSAPTVLRGLFAKTRALAGFHRNLLKNMVEWYLLLHSCLFASDADAGDYQ